MRTFIAVATLAVVAFMTNSNAINLDAMNKIQVESKVEVATTVQDGPTNGEMSEDEKDTLIQVLCPGNVQTSYSQGAGKSSTCNNGVKKAALVQESEEAGDTVIAWIGQKWKQIQILVNVPINNI